MVRICIVSFPKTEKALTAAWCSCLRKDAGILVLLMASWEGLGKRACTWADPLGWLKHLPHSQCPPTKTDEEGALSVAPGRAPYHSGWIGQRDKGRVPENGSVPRHTSKSDHAVMGATRRCFVKALKSSCMVSDFVFIQAVVIWDYRWVGIVRAMRHLRRAAKGAPSRQCADTALVGWTDCDDQVGRIGHHHVGHLI